MPACFAQLTWQRGAAESFTDQRYSRAHTLRFDGGAELPGSSSPQVVPLPYSDAAAIDPEEMFVAALASCHMLWFLSLAAAAGWVVDRYDDAADGELARNAQGRMAMTRVTLRPAVQFGGAKQPTAAELHALHERAHDECFIARSVLTELRCEPRAAVPATP
jgi:organic hydroperoxide reductase OsmC/OhrA